MPKYETLHKNTSFVLLKASNLTGLFIHLKRKQEHSQYLMLNMSHLAGLSAFFSSAVECDPLCAFVQTVKPITWCLFMISHRNLQPLPFTRPAFDIPFLSWTETLLNSELDSDCQWMKHQLLKATVQMLSKVTSLHIETSKDVTIFFCSSLVTATSEYYSALINDISRKNTLSTSPKITLLFHVDRGSPRPRKFTPAPWSERATTAE